jgi:hypothetical protein
MRSGWLAAALFLTTPQSMPGQPELAMPAWLANYQGVTPQTTVAKSLLEPTYTAPAKPPLIIEHYRKLFGAQSLPFVPNFDGIGTVVRATVPECDLMITIRAQDAGTLVRVDCAAKSTPAEAWTALPDSSRPLSGRIPKTPGRDISYEQLVKDLNIHPVYHDAPAPPLAWPDWLVHFKGGRLATKPGVDRAGHEYLKSSYVSSAPMTAIYAFYEDLLKANGYPVYSSELATGQTISGIVQNATGHVEGANYPNGHPGPYTEIRVSFRRSHLNDPITVELKLTTYAFKAPPPFMR